MKTEEELKNEIIGLLENEKIDYQKFLELTSDFIDHDKEYLRFRTDSGTIAHLGRDSIKDHTTAVLELVKNGYDADAKKVIVELNVGNEQDKDNYIRIVDTGTGMSEQDVIKKWLRIGFSSKRVDKVTKKKRRKTGEKGIGRISADRLGSSIKLITKTKKDDLFGLKLNWNDFNRQGVDLLLIPFKRLNNPEINLPKGSITGTEIIISELRNKWTESDLKRLYEELSILISPFRVVKGFEIEIKTNLNSVYQGIIKPKKHLEPEVEISVMFDGESNQISYFLKDKYGISDSKKEKSVLWNHLINKQGDKKPILNDIKKIHTSKDKPACGPVIFDLMFYPRDSALIKGSGFTLNQLKEYLSYNGGVKIYRDNISVKPYGFSGKDGEDWLNLGDRQAQNPAGISREGWMVKNDQMLGAIYISRDENESLEDSAAREGLVHNEAYYDLRALVLSGVRLLELHRHNIHKQLNKDKKERKSSKKILEEYRKELDALKKELTDLRKQAKANNHSYVLSAADHVSLVIEKTNETEKTIEEVLNKNRTLGGLATIGIASAVFGHETQTSISQFQIATNNLMEELKETEPDMDEVIEDAEKAVKYSNQVSEWGAFALTRIKRDKRKSRKTDIKNLLEKVIEDIRATFLAVEIQLLSNFQEVTAKTFPMDIETVLINLLTNSYSACQDTNSERLIKVDLVNSEKNGIAGFEIIVTDSGHGIDEDFREIIWEALYTTKTDEKGNESGTGLGLTIVQSIVDDLDGERDVINDEELGGAKFIIWLPKNL